MREKLYCEGYINKNGKGFLVSNLSRPDFVDKDTVYDSIQLDKIGLLHERSLIMWGWS